MKSRFTLILLASGLLSLSARAALITYTFVPDDDANKLKLTAEVSVDDSLIGMSWQTANPAAFSGSFSASGNLQSPDVTWDLTEITASRFEIQSNRNLVFNYFQASDTATFPIPGYFLNHGGNSISSPLQMTGVWVEKTAAVPEGGATVAMLGVSLLGLFGVSGLRARKAR